MTLSSSLNRNNYVGDGAQVAFAYQFRVDDDAHLQVYLGGALQGSGYVVSNVGNDNGGNVTFSSAPASGAVVTLLRALPLTQPTDIPTQGPLNSAALEQQLDQTVMQVQQLDERIGRSVVLPVSSDVSGLALPTPTAGNLLGWDSGATNLQNYAQGALAAIVPSAFMATLLDYGDAATAQTTLALKDGSAALHVKDLSVAGVESVLAESTSYAFRADSDYAGDAVGAAFFDKPAYDPKIVNAGLSWFPTDANVAVIASQNGVNIDVLFIDRRSGTTVKTLTSADWPWLGSATATGIKFKFGVVAIITSDAGVGAVDLRNGSLVYRDWDATALTQLSVDDVDIGLSGPKAPVIGNGVRPILGIHYPSGASAASFLMNDWQTWYDATTGSAGAGVVAISNGRGFYSRHATTNEVRTTPQTSFIEELTGDGWS
ncbi:MAG: hypothetical protein RID42_00185 [Alphaproteobacteria bacterium]